MDTCPDNLPRPLPTLGARSYDLNEDRSKVSSRSRTLHMRPSCSEVYRELQKQCLKAFLLAGPHSRTEILSGAS